MKNKKKQFIKDNLLFLFGSMALGTCAYLLCEFLNFIGAAA